MPPRGVSSNKRARQYEHIKESAQKRGRSTKRAKQIAAATVNKQRREAGETRGSRKKSGGGSTRKSAGSSRTRTGTSSRTRTSGSRKSSSGSRKSSSRSRTSSSRAGKKR